MLHGNQIVGEKIEASSIISDTITTADLTVGNFKCNNIEIGGFKNSSYSTDLPIDTNKIFVGGIRSNLT